MSKQIQIRNEIYNLLKKQKGKTSFSDVIEELLNIQRNKEILQREDTDDNL